MPPSRTALAVRLWILRDGEAKPVSHLFVQFSMDPHRFNTPIDVDDWRDIRAGDQYVWLSGERAGTVETVAYVELDSARPPQRPTVIVSAREWERLAWTLTGSLRG